MPYNIYLDQLTFKRKKFNQNDIFDSIIHLFKCFSYCLFTILPHKIK